MDDSESSCLEATPSPAISFTRWPPSLYVVSLLSAASLHAVHALHSYVLPSSSSISSQISSFFSILSTPAASLYTPAFVAALIALGPGREPLASGLRSLLRCSPTMHSLVAIGAGTAALSSVVALLFPSSGLSPCFEEVWYGGKRVEMK